MHGNVLLLKPVVHAVSWQTTCKSLDSAQCVCCVLCDLSTVVLPAEQFLGLSLEVKMPVCQICACIVLCMRHTFAIALQVSSAEVTPGIAAMMQSTSSSVHDSLPAAVALSLDLAAAVCRRAPSGELSSAAAGVSCQPEGQLCRGAANSPGGC